MILSATTRDKLIGQLRGIVAQRPDFSFVQRESFQDAFVHGLSIAAGGAIGLLIWYVLQPAPQPASPYAAYHVVAGIEGDHKAAQAVVAHGPAAQTSPVADASAPAHATPDPHAPAVTADSGHAPEKVTVPLDGLYEDSGAYGRLPVIRKSDHLRPFDAYRQPFAADQLSRPLIAVVMLDYGLSAQASGSVLGVMPPEVNMILSPATREADKWAQQAYDHGHEMWLGLAVEPPDYPASDPGAQALLTAAPVEKNQAALLTQLGRGVGYTGVFAPFASPYFTSGADADFIAEAVFSRGLGLMVNAPAVSKIMAASAEQNKAPFYAGSMILLDATQTEDAIAKARAQVEAAASRNGFAIALFHPGKLSRREVLGWLTTLKGKGFALAPLSVIAERRLEAKP